ncbi:MAG: cytochrome c oxidase accessory protein CcoG [Wenzhouxiangellaceae bacterium]|nr:cytochrome c oxidase accessory protein CcoG [Wenzhouxiangellaceae bacterium]
MSQASESGAPEELKLYVKAPKVYPRETGGRFSRLRVLSAWVLLGLFYALPWINVDGQQVVLFDLPAREFHIFGLVFWPQDFFMLALLLAIAAITLFFVTALAGRLWCGYACPQTVWTEVFLWMERFVEGPRNRRIRLDKAPWNAEKIRKKTAKQFLYITFSFWTGLTFVGFFTPIRDLVPAVFAFRASGWESFWIGFYGLATYGNAGYLREQVCKYMCPYARFQAAMFDRESLVISYDEKRGEPRGKRRKDADKASLGLGDCIDCHGCVQVCPTGIDIRDGLQIECIACAACIDVCDEVMDKMDYPRGLIRYTTEAAKAGEKTRIFRPRILIYIGMLAALTTLFGLVLTGRDMVDVDVLRDRSALYRMAGDQIENPFALKITNRTDDEIRLQVAAEGLEGLTVVSPVSGFSVPAGGVSNRPMTLAVPIEAIGPGMHQIEIRLSNAATGELLTGAESRFYVPPNPR